MKTIQLRTSLQGKVGGPTCTSISKVLGLSGTPKTGQVRQMVVDGNGTVTVYVTDDVVLSATIKTKVQAAVA